MNNIKKYRDRAGLSQSRLAQKVGVTQAAIAQYEKQIRQPSGETLENLAKVLDVSADMLLSVDALPFGDDEMAIARVKVILDWWTENQPYLHQVEELLGPGDEPILMRVTEKLRFESVDFAQSRFIGLAKYSNDGLVTRSQAKRLLTEADKFKVVIFDFWGVEAIGQAFADEIFRVFRNQHPGVQIMSINTGKDVRQMISRAENHLKQAQQND